MNISELFLKTSKEFPGKVAIIDPQKNNKLITFSALHQSVYKKVLLLKEKDLHAAGGVLIFSNMCAELYEALIAIFNLNLVAIFVEQFSSKDFIERACQMYPPKVLIGIPKAHLLHLTSSVLRNIPFKFSIGRTVPGAVLWELSNSAKNKKTNQSLNIDRENELPDLTITNNDNVIAGNAKSFFSTATSAETGALLTFTSGSTGAPKAAMRTHDFLSAQHSSLSKTLSLNPDDIVMTNLPIFVLSHLASGVTTVLPDADLRSPGKINPKPVVSQLLEFKVSVLEASPAFLERILLFAKEKNILFTSIRKIFTGGAPVFPHFMNALQNIAPNAEITALYGSTEAEPISHITFDEIEQEDDNKMRSGYGLLAGTVVPEVRLQIIPDNWGSEIGPFTEQEFTQRALQNSQIGEIVVTGKHVLKGYLNGDGDKETKFKVDGTVWHRTGDAGYIDEKKRLWLAGRCAALISDSKGKIYPFSVECAAAINANIKKTAFVSINGLRVLVVELKSTHLKFNVDELANTIKWANIDKICVLKKIPVDKRHNSKIDYPLLYSMLKKLYK